MNFFYKKLFFFFIASLIFLIFSFSLLTVNHVRKVFFNEKINQIDKRKQIGDINAFPLVLLVSLPGSGNTWLRQLFEETSGFYTGSVYNDMSLFEGGMYGETLRFEDGQTPLVKTHR